MASTLHRYRAPKNFFTWLRRLAPWRSRTRLGRATAVLLSMLLGLMMLGTAGPAYAEGTTPEEPTAKMSTLAAEEEPAGEEKAAEPQAPEEQAPEKAPEAEQLVQ